MFNKPYAYNHNVALAANTGTRVQHRMLEDFYAFDINGVDSVATGQNLRMVIRNITENRSLITPQIAPTDTGRLRSGLVAAMVSGDSSWYFPTKFKQGDVLEFEYFLDAGSPAVDLDISILGYHHMGGTPAYCAEPRKLHWYYWDFDTVNAGVVDTVTSRIVVDSDFIGVGWVSTDNCTTVDSLLFKVTNETLGYNYMNERVMGSALFPGINNTVRRNRFRIPWLLEAGSLVTIECENTTVGNVLDVAVAMYGFHVPRGSYASL